MAARLSLRRWLADDGGTTAIEYGLIVCLIFLVVITSVTAFGNKTTALINSISVAITAAIGP